MWELKLLVNWFLRSVPIFHVLILSKNSNKFNFNSFYVCFPHAFSYVGDLAWLARNIGDVAHSLSQEDLSTLYVFDTLLFDRQQYITV